MRAIGRARLAVLALTVAGLDQLTKSVVASSLAEGESVRVIGNFLRITHIRNSGAAFGLLRGFGGLLALVALVGVIAFFAVVVQNPPAPTGVAAALVGAGALGNLLDRLVRGPIGRGTVVDFVDFRFWPAFNVADSAVTVGALLILWSELGRSKPARPSES
ncbi:MAG: signal peptidase II [Actinomycetota bacterium]